MVSLLLWALILWACFGVGAAALSRFRASPDSPAEEVPFAVAIGLGLLSYLVLAAGLLGQLEVPVGIGLVALLAALGWRHMVRLAREVGVGLRAIRWRWLALPLSLFFVGAGALMLIGALAPAGDNDYDGLFYHLTLPKLYLRYGAITPLPWLSHSNFPFLMEMLYLLGLLLKGQVLAKLFHFGFGWLTALAIYAFGRRWGGSRAGALGAAAFVSVPFVGWEMMSAYNELAFALYAFLAIYALALWYEKRAAGWLWVCALMCGVALGVKMLAMAVAGFVVCSLVYDWIAVWATQRVAPTDRGRAVWRVVAFGLIVAAVAAPWYVKSYLWTGNPGYPFFYEVFGGRYWSAERAREYTAAQQAFGLGGGPLRFLALPWNLTMQGQWFFDQPGVLRVFNLQIAVFGPLLLAFLPTLLYVGPVGRAGRLVLWAALLYTGLWFMMAQNSRYLLPILPGLCACAGLAASRLLARRGPTAVAAMAAFALVCVGGLKADYLLAAPAARVALDLEGQADYLRRTSFAYNLGQAVTNATPSNAKIMVLGDEPRMFYLDRDFLLGNHANIFSAQDLGSAAGLRAALRRRGVTHVLVHTSTLQNIAARRGAMETRLAELIAEHELLPVAQLGPMSLWELASEKR